MCQVLSGEITCVVWVGNLRFCDKNMMGVLVARQKNSHHVSDNQRNVNILMQIGH